MDQPWKILKNRYVDDLPQLILERGTKAAHMVGVLPKV